MINIPNTKESFCPCCDFGVETVVIKIPTNTLPCDAQPVTRCFCTGPPLPKNGAKRFDRVWLPWPLTVICCQDKLQPLCQWWDSFFQYLEEEAWEPATYLLQWLAAHVTDQADKDFIQVCCFSAEFKDVIENMNTRTGELHEKELLPPDFKKMDSRAACLIRKLCNRIQGSATLQISPVKPVKSRQQMQQPKTDVHPSECKLISTSSCWAEELHIRSVSTSWKTLSLEQQRVVSQMERWGWKSWKQGPLQFHNRDNKTSPKDSMIPCTVLQVCCGQH